MIMHTPKTNIAYATVALALALSSCNLFLNRESDVQLLVISFHFHLFGQYDSRTGMFLKELSPGVATARFFLTVEEKRAVSSAISRTGFYQYPDTLPLWQFAKADVAPGPYFLFIDDGRVSKMVVWHYPPDNRYQQIDDIAKVITDIIKKKPEFKELPPSNFHIEL